MALTASQKMSEEVEAPNVDHAKKWNTEYSSLKKQIVAMIAYMAPRGNILEEIKKMADGIKITYSRTEKNFRDSSNHNCWSSGAIDFCNRSANLAH